MRTLDDIWAFVNGPELVRRGFARKEGYTLPSTPNV
jgi:hypothetical protein